MTGNVFIPLPCFEKTIGNPLPLLDSAAAAASSRRV
jgi:hypothetical protein